jgi:hypothetical protein
MIADIQYGTFLFFGTSVVCGLTFSYFFLPETKGVSLEDMDIMFASKGFASQKRRNLDQVLTERREVLATEKTTFQEKNAVQQEEKEAEV